jgi:hypothetical protein
VWAKWSFLLLLCLRNVLLPSVRMYSARSSLKVNVE